MNLRFQHLLFSIVFTCLLSVNTHAQNVNNVLRDTFFYPNQTCANVWGYVDSLENEYALVGASQGLSIVNVTKPDSIWQMKQLPGPHNLWKEIRTYKHYAYCTSEGGGGLQIIDLKNLPDTTTPWHYWQPVVNGKKLTKIHALHIDTATGYIYLYGCNGGFEGTMIAKLTDPYNPTYRGKYGDKNNYVHDGIVRNGIMYASKIYDGTVTFVDVNVDSLPVEKGIQKTPGAFTHNTWLSDDNNYLFTTDEISNSFLACYDIQNLSNVKFMDKIQSNSGSSSIVHNTYYKNGFCFTSWYRDGYTIVDASRPENLIQVGNYDTFTDTGDGFNGTWGVYPYLPSGNILLSNMDTSSSNKVGALFVVTPTLQHACYLEGNVIDSATTFPLSNVHIHVSSSSTTFADSTQLNGNFATGTVNAGFYNVTFSKSGYHSKTFSSVSLQNKLLTSLNVKLIQVSTTEIEEYDLKKSISITTSFDKVMMIKTSQNKLLQLKLVDVSGKEIYQMQIQEHVKILDLKEFSSGIYFVKVIDEKNNSAIYKVAL